MASDGDRGVLSVPDAAASPPQAFGTEHYLDAVQALLLEILGEVEPLPVKGTPGALLTFPGLEFSLTATWSS